ncbi:unnamed protein product [Victoria cruziana]
MQHIRLRSRFLRKWLASQSSALRSINFCNRSKHESAVFTRVIANYLPQRMNGAISRDYKDEVETKLLMQVDNMG